MTSEQKKKLKKEFRLGYFYKFQVATCVTLFSLLAVFLVCLIFMTLRGTNNVALIAMIISLAVLLVASIVFLVLSVKYQRRLIAQRTAEIEGEFVDLPFEEVTATLTEKRVITEHGFVANVGQYAGQLVAPFDEATVSVYSANIYTKVCSAVVIRSRNGIIAEYVLDNVLFNYICKKGVKLNFVGYSRLLVQEKPQFVKVHIKGSKERNTMGFLFGAVGMLISDETNDVNLSKKTVLDVLSKNMQ